MIVNGREYTLWGQLVKKKAEFIGGILEDSGDDMDRRLFNVAPESTVITDITLGPNGKDSACFTICGKDFDSGFDVEVGGIIGGEEGWLTFSGYGGHLFRIKKIKQLESGIPGR